MYRPGDNYYQQFTTFNISGISTNTDSTPLGTMVKNGADDFGPKVFVTNIDTGRYTASGTIPPTYAYGNSVNLVVSGQVAGNLSKGIISLGVLDAYVSALPAGTTVSVTGGAPANFLPPAATVSVTGVIPLVSLVTTTTTVTNPVSANSFTAGLTVSITGGAPTNFLPPGATVSVTGTPQVNVVSANPAVTFSVTGVIPLVSTVTNVTNPVSTNPVTVSVINPGLSVSVTGGAPANFLPPGATVSVTGVIPLVSLVTTTTNVTNNVNANLVGSNAGVTVSVTGVIPLVSTVTNLTNPVTVNAINQGLTISVTGGAPINFLPPATTVSITGALPPIGSVNSVLNPVSVTGINYWSTVEMEQIRYKVGIDGAAIIPTSGISHLELSPSGWEQVMIEPGVNARQSATFNSAALAGTSSGNGSLIYYQGVNNPTQDRIISNATSGIRSTVNYKFP